MDITKLIETLPDSVKGDILDFYDVRLKGGRYGTRVVMDRMLTQDEIAILSKREDSLGLDCVATYKYAPEIKKSYFYVV